MIDATSSKLNTRFSPRHCQSFLSKRATTWPARHQSESDIVAAAPKVRPSRLESCIGPFASAAKDAAAPTVIAHPFGLYQSIQIPPISLVGCVTFFDWFGARLRAS